MKLQPGLNIQESTEVEDILKANGVEMGIQDTVSLYNESPMYKGHDFASFRERTAWLRLTDDAGGVYEVLFDGRLRGGEYGEGELRNIYPDKWDDYARFTKGGISYETPYTTSDGFAIEHKAVVELPTRYNEKEKTKHALELANGLREALNVKLRALIPNYEVIELMDLPTTTERQDALR